MHHNVRRPTQKRDVLLAEGASNAFEISFKPCANLQCPRWRPDSRKLLQLMCCSHHSYGPANCRPPVTMTHSTTYQRASTGLSFPHSINVVANNWKNVKCMAHYWRGSVLGWVNFCITRGSRRAMLIVTCPAAAQYLIFPAIVPCKVLPVFTSWKPTYPDALNRSCASHDCTSACKMAWKPNKNYFSFSKFETCLSLVAPFFYGSQTRRARLWAIREFLRTMKGREWGWPIRNTYAIYFAFPLCKSGTIWHSFMAVANPRRVSLLHTLPITSAKEVAGDLECWSIIVGFEKP
eukprot:1154321-Pelagomonas_calceolata.AAC.4